MGKQKVTAEMQEQMISMRTQGFCYHEIADKLNVHETTVRNYLINMGYGGWKSKRKLKMIENVENPTIRKIVTNSRYNLLDISRLIGCSTDKAEAFLQGDREVRFSITQIKRILKAFDLTFEEVFGGV